eukprot:4197443-Amphidinium_carterae.3
MEFYVHNTLAYASPSQTEMLRKALWTRAAHADLKFDSGWYEKVQHGHDYRPSLMNYTAITLIKSCEGESVPPHRDRFNLGESSVISIGTSVVASCGQKARKVLFRCPLLLSM